jgi:hypothetical protein
MRRAQLYRVGRLPLLTALGLSLVCGQSGVAKAQSQPPLSVPFGGPPPADPEAITIEGWQLRGALDTVVQNSNNYLLTSPASLSGWAAGLNPHATAEWSNGIHSTILYGTYQHLQYNSVGTDDGEATITQRYSPLRDLTFSLLGDYTHRTIGNILTNSIPTTITTTATTVLPNGNTVLPNGTIVSPSGQIVGQVGQTAGAGGVSVVNPFDQFTGAARAEKIFNGGVLSLGASVLRYSYENQASKAGDFTAKTFTEDAAFWLGPLFYAYSDGSFTARTNTQPVPDSTAYRVIGGIGTRQFGLFRASAYVGHQGSQASGSGSAEGIVYGGAISYDPLPTWSLSANYDDTTNISSQISASTQALSLPSVTPLLLPTSSSTEVSTITLRSEYRPATQWAAIGLVGFTKVRYLDSPQMQDAWLADATLQYDVLRNLTLTWECQYTSIVSNHPASSVSRELVIMRSSYRF